MRRQRLLTLAGLLVLLVIGWSPAYGVPPKKKAPGKEVPLRITAARLEADQKAGVITFSGQVKADYGDATLYADQLRVYYKAQPGKGAAPAARKQLEQSPLGDFGSQKIDHIVARGHVRFVQGDRVATGKEAIYYGNRDEVVLRGNPQVWQAENTLKGGRIIFNLKTNKALVESSPRRKVEALLYTKGSEGKSGLPLGPKAPKGQQP